MIIQSFKGPHAYLSNFYVINIHIADKVNPTHMKLWRTSEHMYMASKTTNPVVQETIRCMHTPEQAKRYARKVQLRPNWDTYKFGLMLRILTLKFTLNQECHDKLLLTGDDELIEGNYWHDNCWGDCNCSKCHQTQGQNHLGKLLMQVRNTLRSVPL